MTQEVVSLNSLDQYAPSKLKLYLRTWFYWLPFVTITYPDPLEWALRKHVDALKKQVHCHIAPLPQPDLEALQALIAKHKTSSFKTKIIAWLERFGFSMNPITTQEPRTKPKKVDPVNHAVVKQLNEFIQRYTSPKNTLRVSLILQQLHHFLDNIAGENQETKAKLYPILENFIDTEIGNTKEILRTIRDWTLENKTQHCHDKWWRHLESISKRCIQILRKESPYAETMTMMIDRLIDEVETYVNTTKAKDPQFTDKLKQLQLLYKLDETPWFQKHELIEENTHLKQLQEDQERSKAHREFSLCPLLGSEQPANWQILEGLSGSTYINRQSTSIDTHHPIHQGMIFTRKHNTNPQHQSTVLHSIVKLTAQ